jgi:hypothetical protein
VEIKCRLDATDEFLLQILLLVQHVSGTIMPIIRFVGCCSPQTGHNPQLHIIPTTLKPSTKYDRQQPLV